MNLEIRVKIRERVKVLPGENDSGKRELEILIALRSA
jgi:hypothetical protein